jgi:hypothetical protein
MLQIVYISTARPDFEPEQVNRILAAARARNQENNVTGLIFFNGKRFMQALEGEEAVVRETYARIVESSRHFAVVKLSEKTITAREFGPWAMAGFAITDDDMDKLIATVDWLVADVPDLNLREQFRSFARMQRAA